jgi:hypothetical protein
MYNLNNEQSAVSKEQRGHHDETATDKYKSTFTPL